MVWTSEELFSLKDAPFPCTKEELIDYANDKGLPNSVIKNLIELEEEEEERSYDSLKDICSELFPDVDEYVDDY